MYKKDPRLNAGIKKDSRMWSVVTGYYIINLILNQRDSLCNRIVVIEDRLKYLFFIAMVHLYINTQYRGLIGG